MAMTMPRSRGASRPAASIGKHGGSAEEGFPRGAERKAFECPEIPDDRGAYPFESPSFRATTVVR